MRWFIVGEHEVYNVGLRADEDDLEDGVPHVFGRVGPEEVEVACYVDGKVEELGFEGDAGCALEAISDIGLVVCQDWRGDCKLTLELRIFASSMKIEAT